MAGGGILFDHGWHALYCILRWAGAPRGVAAALETRRFHEWPLEDTATLTWIWPPATATSTSPGPPTNAPIISRSRASKAASVSSARAFSSDRGRAPLALSAAPSEGSHHPDWFAGVAEDFRDCGDGRRQRQSGRGLLCARLIDLAQRSSAAGGARLSLDD